MNHVDLLKEMLEIYSPSGKERELALFLKDKFTNLGFTNARLDTVGNVIGEVGKGSPVILLCGHMDTVSGQIPVRLEDEKIYGRGAVDAKSSLAAMISAAYELSLESAEGKLIVAGVVDEERNSRGIRHLIRERLGINYAIFGEPSGLGNVTFAYKGRLDLRVRCRTETGHVGAQHLYNNAIEKSYELWSKLRKAFDDRISARGIFYSVTLCLIGIQSRRSTSSIPDNCTLRIDARLPPPVKCTDIAKIIGGLAEQFQKENPNILVDLKIVDMVEPFVADRDTILIKALEESIKEVLHKSPKFVKKTGTGDMNIVGSEMGIPVVTYGPGDTCLSHTKNEYIKLEEYLTSIEVYKKTLKKTIIEDHISKTKSFR